MHIQRPALIVWTLLQACLWACWLSPRSGLSTAEERWTDRLSARVAATTMRPLPPQIRCIGIDDATIAWLAKPSAFWDHDLGVLVQGLLDGGARVVGLDYISNVATDNLPPAVAEAIETSRLPLIRAIASGKVVLVDLPDAPGSPGAHPHPVYAETAAQSGNLCNGVVAPSSDGVVRRILTVGGAGTEVPSLAFALRLAELALGGNLELQNHPPQLTLAGRAIPVEAYGSEWTSRLYWQRTEIPWVSAATLLTQLKEGKKLEGYADTICVIGPQALSFGDLRTTALDLLPSKAQRGGTLGMEIHAAALESLLQGEFIQPYAPVAGYLLATLLALLFLVLGLRVELRKSLVMAVVLQFIYACCSYLAWRQRIWLPYVGVVGASLTGYFTGYVWRYLDVERERKKTRDFFSKMVAPQVVDRVLSDPQSQMLGGTHRRVTVLYSDINDFTPVCERHTPAEVIVLLNNYFEAMVEIIFEHEGMLKQFVGDEIMVIYGAPVYQPDHAARAVRTALAMQERLEKMLAESGGVDGFFDIKLGVHTGDVVVGHVGSEAHMEYAAVGDDVNLGARIMATTKKVGIKLLVSAVTQREAAPILQDVEWISHGVHSFKGKSAEMELFEVRRKSKSEVKHG